MENSKPFIKNFTYLFSGNVLSQLAPLLFAPVIGRLYSPEEMGVLAHFSALAGLIGIVAAGRYEMALVLPKSESQAKNILALALVIAAVVVTLSGGLIFLKERIAEWYESPDFGNYVKWVFLGVAVLVFNAIFTQWAVRGKHYKKISVSKLILSFSLNISTVVLGYYNFGSGGLIIGWLIGYGIGTLPLLYGLRNHKNEAQENNTKVVRRKEMLNVAKEHKSFPTINALHAFTDKFFSEYVLFNAIQLLFGGKYLGDYFQMNRYLKRPIGVIGGSVSQVFYKEATEAYNAQRDLSPIFFKALKLTLLFAVPISLVVFFLGEWAFTLYLGDQWQTVGECAKWMSIPVFFNFLTSPVSTLQLIYKKQFKAFILSLVGYIVSICSIFVAYKLGYGFIFMIKCFAAAQSLYYIALLLWYFSLIRGSK